MCIHSFIPFFYSLNTYTRSAHSVLGGGEALETQQGTDRQNPCPHSALHSTGDDGWGWGQTMNK